MQKIFGIDPDQKVTPNQVRDAILECFYLAHCNDTEFDQGEEALTREYCKTIVKKKFVEAGANFDTPNKEDILLAMDELKKFSQNFRKKEAIEKNYQKIMQLVEKLD